MPSQSPLLIAHPDRTTDITLVRHGQTEWNLEHRFMGNRPIPIDDDGRGQVTRAATLLRDLKPEVVASSPALRAVQTAELLCREIGIDREVRTHPGLSELEMGEWVGRPIEELRELPLWEEFVDHPERMAFPGGEAVPDVQARAVAAVNDLVAEAAGEILITTHGGIVRSIVLAASGRPLSEFFSVKVAFAGIYKLRLAPGGDPQVLEVNLTPEGAKIPPSL